MNKSCITVCVLSIKCFIFFYSGGHHGYHNYHGYKYLGFRIRHRRFSYLGKGKLRKVSM